MAIWFVCHFIESPKDYLETKKRILALREKYGEDNWLRNHAGTSVQDIMGLQSASQSTSSVQSLTDVNTTSPFYDTSICTMRDVQLAGESEPREVQRPEDGLQDEGILLDEPVPGETSTTASMATYDLSEGEDRVKCIFLYYQWRENSQLLLFFLFCRRGWRFVHRSEKERRAPDGGCLPNNNFRVRVAAELANIFFD